MMTTFRFSARAFLTGAALLIIVGASCISGISPVKAAISDFTFIHITDEHSSAYPETGDTIADMLAIGSVHLDPYNVTALPPSFIVETGDDTNMGPLDGAYDTLNRWYGSTKLPRYLVIGNHDSTWTPLTPEVEKLYGSTYYSFDKYRCHFVVLNSEGLLDSRPVFSPEELDWLKADLKKAGNEVPVFICYHHPIDDPNGEFPPYNREQLLDVVRPCNLAMFYFGHLHTPVAGRFDDFDWEEGGPAFHDDEGDRHGYRGSSTPIPPGYQIVSVLNGTLRVATKQVGKSTATVPMLEKPLAPPASRYPTITIDSPVERSKYTFGKPMKVKVSISGVSEPITSASVQEDGDAETSLAKQDDGSYQCALTSSAPGAHFITALFTGQSGKVYHRSTCYYADNDKVIWRVYTGSASRSVPRAFGETLFVGANDGYVRAYRIRDGKPVWKYKTGGSVTGSPLVSAGNVYFGSEDGYLYCVSSSSGRLVRKFNAGDPIYSTCVTDSDNIYFGTRDGLFFSIKASDGTLNWKNTSAHNCIGTKPLLADGKIYFGSSTNDGIYCLNATDGSEVWRAKGQSYMIASTSGPVVLKGKVFATDARSNLFAIDSTGEAQRIMNRVSAVTVSSDHEYIYARTNGGNLLKIGPKSQVWSAAVSMDNTPEPPVEADGAVYTVSSRGLVSAVSADSGKVLWQYQATPGNFVFSTLGLSDKNEFLCATDGSLTAFKR
jgi:outer membrane protein assembly factor BamB